MSSATVSYKTPTFENVANIIEKMFSKITHIAVILTCIISFCTGKLNGRIVNGTDAAPGEIPYIVSLRGFGLHMCGGAILDDKHILTAAHCILNPLALSLTIQYGVTEITSGDSAPNIINVTKAVIKPDFELYGGYYNDVAVLELAEAMVFGKEAHPVSLPTPLADTPDGCEATLAGWGIPFTGGQVMQHLQKVTVPVYSDEACEAWAANTDNPTNSTYNLCAGDPEGGRGQCNGDSGSPLVNNGTLIGVVSWSVKPCQSKGHPGVFAKVSTQVSWIMDQIKSG